MHLTVNSQVLATELRLVNKVVPAKPAIVHLGCVLLKADDKLHFYGTDLEVGLSASCAADVTMPGIAALPATRLLAMVEQFNDADVTIQHGDNGQAIISCGRYTAKMQTLAVENFPAQPAPAADAPILQLDATRFSQLIHKTRYAISATAAKHVLQGALLTTEIGKGTAMVATDGKRLALATMTGNDDIARHIIIPSKTLDLIGEHSSSGSIVMTVGARHLFFDINSRRLTSRMFDGKFPKYGTIIPKTNDKQIIVDRLEARAALKRVVLAAEANRAIYFHVENDSLHIAARSSEAGQAEETILATYAGDALKLCVGGNYVLDFLEAAVEPMITFHLKDAKSAMLVTDGIDHIGVIMLMRA
jgi:DNA polymerase-3 subunit beta